MNDRDPFIDRFFGICIGLALVLLCATPIVYIIISN